MIQSNNHLLKINDKIVLKPLKVCLGGGGCLIFRCGRADHTITILKKFGA